MTNRRASITAILTLLFAFLSLAAPASTLAGEQGTNCPTDPERVRFYENAIGDTSDNNDSVIFCGLGVHDFDTIPHTLPGTCKAGLKWEDDWNDCITSVHPIIPSGRKLCFYGWPNFQVAETCLYPGDSNVRVNIGSIGTLGNDQMTSWHFLCHGPGC